MPRQGQPDDPVAPEPEVHRHPDRAEVDAAFETARNLLNDALDEVRVSTPDPRTAQRSSSPTADAPDGHGPARSRRRRERNEVAAEPGSEELDREFTPPSRPRRPRTVDTGDPLDALIVEFGKPVLTEPAELYAPATPDLAPEPVAPVIDEIAAPVEPAPTPDLAPEPVALVVDEVAGPAEPAADESVSAESTPEPVVPLSGEETQATATPDLAPEPVALVVDEIAAPDEPAPDPVVLSPGEETRASGPELPQVSERPRSCRCARLAAALAAVIVGVGVLAVVFAGGGSDSSETSGVVVSKSARLVFDPITTAEGATVQRVWRLRGKDGARFVGTLSFSNPTSAPIEVNHTEVFPKSLTSSVDDIQFDRRPVVLQADPVVRYSVTVPAGKEVTARYEIQVAPDGAKRSRLETWAHDLESTPPDTSPSTTTTTAPAPPGTIPTGGGTVTPRKPASPPATARPAPAPAPVTGTIVIRVVSRNGTGTFGFSGPGGSVSVTTSGAPDGVGQSGSMTVPVGRYSWTEVSRPPGFGAPSIDCTDRDAGPFQNRSTVSGATANFNVQAGETVVCTWTNLG